jgi:hypothetical protein
MFKLRTLNIAALKALVIAMSSLTGDIQAFACSAYAPVNTAIMAANYDWTVSGGLIFANDRGWEKEAFLADDSNGQVPAKWRTRYASLTLSQWGREFPMQGLNEFGLSGVVLNAPANYPSSPSDSRQFITEMQWLQYQLDNYRSVVEVEANIHRFSIQKINAALHLFFCDATKDCGLVEFQHGQAVMHRIDVRAITNSSYEASQNAWNRYNQNGPLPLGYDSLNRVVRATWYARHSPVSEIDLFHNLKDLGTSGWTNWHSVFDLSTKTVMIKPWQSDQRYVIQRSEFANNCDTSTPTKMRRIANGRIYNWENYKSEPTRTLLDRASAPINGFSTQLKEKMIAYSDIFKCAASPKKER